MITGLAAPQVALEPGTLSLIDRVECVDAGECVQVRPQ
jgi:hypothetical protein